jgi:hypothetical protein
MPSMSRGHRLASVTGAAAGRRPGVRSAEAANEHRSDGASRLLAERMGITFARDELAAAHSLPDLGILVDALRLLRRRGAAARRQAKSVSAKSLPR